MSRLAVGIAVSFGALFAIVGVAVLIYAGLRASEEFETARTARAEGIVVAVQGKGGPTVEFRAPDGRSLRFLDSARDAPPYAVGERVVVFYDPRQPGKASLKSADRRWKDIVTPGVVGTGFAIAGIAVGVIAVRRYRKIQYLLRHGLRREGSIIGFERERRSSASVGRKNGSGSRTVWFVVVEWTDQTGRQRRERSDMLNSDPSEKFSGEDSVVVLVDPKNSDRFWIDLFGESESVPVVATTDKPIVRR